MCGPLLQVRRGHAAIEQEDLVAALDKQLFESLGVSMMDDEQKSLYEKVRYNVLMEASACTVLCCE